MATPISTAYAFSDDVSAELQSIAEMLIKKNSAYGDSALSPVRIFSECSTDEQLRVRIDDKLSRLASGTTDDEDIVADLIGYLILLRIHRRRQKSTWGKLL